MFSQKRIPIYDFVYAISEIVDLVSPVLNNHHKSVAYLSCRIAQEMGLPVEDVQDITLASLVHDIGAFSIGERTNIMLLGVFETGLNQHALAGYKLLKDFPPLLKVARIIKDHHLDFDKSRRKGKQGMNTRIPGRRK